SSNGVTAPLPTIANGGAGATSSTTLTTAVNNQAHSLFYNQRIPTNADFSIVFRFSQNNQVNPADGLTFTIQGNGPAFVGGAGGSIGYSGTFGRSFALDLDV